MSAFCGKYPSCGCIGVGTKCYDGDTVIKNSELPNLKGACDLSAPVEVPQDSTIIPQEQEVVRLTEQQEADKIGVSLSKFQAMKGYARQLHLTDKRMKTSTIRRKVCEKYKVKLT